MSCPCCGSAIATKHLMGYCSFICTQRHTDWKDRPSDKQRNMAQHDETQHHQTTCH